MQAAWVVDFVTTTVNCLLLKTTHLARPPGTQRVWYGQKALYTTRTPESGKAQCRQLEWLCNINQTQTQSKTEVQSSLTFKGAQDVDSSEAHLNWQAEHVFGPCPEAAGEKMMYAIVVQAERWFCSSTFWGSRTTQNHPCKNRCKTVTIKHLTWTRKPLKCYKRTATPLGLQATRALNRANGQWSA